MDNSGFLHRKKIKNEAYTKKILKRKKDIPFLNYALSKYIFTKLCLKIAKKNNIKCRVLRLFHVYGKNENRQRLWPSVLNAAKKNKKTQQKIKTSKQYIYIYMKNQT